MKKKAEIGQQAAGSAEDFADERPEIAHSKGADVQQDCPSVEENTNGPPKFVQSPAAANPPLPWVPLVLAISVPLGEIKPGYSAHHVNAQLVGEEKDTMRRLLDGLVRSGATIASGQRRRPVTGSADVLRWIMQELQKKYQESGRN